MWDSTAPPIAAAAAAPSYYSHQFPILVVITTTTTTISGDGSTMFIMNPKRQTLNLETELTDQTQVST